MRRCTIRIELGGNVTDALRSVLVLETRLKRRVLLFDTERKEIRKRWCLGRVSGRRKLKLELRLKAVYLRECVYACLCRASSPRLGDVLRRSSLTLTIAGRPICSLLPLKGRGARSHKSVGTYVVFNFNVYGTMRIETGECATRSLSHTHNLNSSIAHVFLRVHV